MSRRLTMQPSHHVFKEMLEKVDIVSFDVFDTLLHRLVMRPEDVFRAMETDGLPSGFAERRVAAERLARKRFATKKAPEVSLDQIYEIINQDQNATRLDLNDELAAERRFLISNPAIVPLLEAARQAGKGVIAISDMYLSRAQIDGLLKSAGVIVDSVYSSCDERERGLGKFNGSIFAHVAETEGVSLHRLLHVGDNYVSDYLNAIKSGAMAFFVPMTAEQVTADLDGFSRLVECGDGSVSGSLIAALVKHKASWLCECDSYAIGYRIGGPLLLGFALFLLDSARRDGVTRLNLLARDGFVVADVLEALGVTDPDFEVTAASRRMFVFPAACKTGIEKWSALGSGHVEPMGWDAFCRIVGLQPDALDPARTPETHASFAQHWAHALKKLAVIGEAESEALRGYYSKRMIGKAGGKAAWVDVGWGLSTIQAADSLLEERLPGYFVGIHKKGYLRDGLDGYLFRGETPASLSKTIMRGVEIIELFFSHASASAVRAVDHDGQFEIEYGEKGANDLIRDAFQAQVKRGVIDFVRDAARFRDVFNSDEMREFNRRQIAALIANPTLKEFAALAVVPHTRSAGNSTWGFISDYWKPDLAQRCDLAQSPWSTRLKSRTPPGKKKLSIGKKIMRELLRPFK